MWTCRQTCSRAAAALWPFVAVSSSWTFTEIWTDIEKPGKLFLLLFHFFSLQLTRTILSRMTDSFRLVTFVLVDPLWDAVHSLEFCLWAVGSWLTGWWTSVVSRPRAAPEAVLHPRGAAASSGEFLFFSLRADFYSAEKTRGSQTWTKWQQWRCGSSPSRPTWLHLCPPLLSLLSPGSMRFILILVMTLKTEDVRWSINFIQWKHLLLGWCVILWMHWLC